jgi:hypothetical protein
MFDARSSTSNIGHRASGIKFPEIPARLPGITLQDGSV